MFNKKGLMLSWFLSWLGTFSWLYGFTVYFFFLNLILAAAIGLIFSFLSLFFIFFITPWKYPNTKYYYLFAPPFFLIIISIFWLIYFLQPITKENFSIFWFSWIIFILFPFIGYGKKTWNDHNF